ncbi:hypothetical protein J2T21_004093 [Paeniglutamicibacter psychrophenolicus]|nr:hypothetical protein [Paeniglutamicibacter psychrophenolicus]
MRFFCAGGCQKGCARTLLLVCYLNNTDSQEDREPEGHFGSVNPRPTRDGGRGTPHPPNHSISTQVH